MTEAEQVMMIEKMTSGNGLDCTGMSFEEWPAKLFNGKKIKNCCFYQEDKPDSHIFPNSMKDVEFKRCNLDNVFVSSSNTIGKGCCNKRIKVQPPTPKANPKKDDTADGGFDWFVDKNHKPVEPLDKKKFEEEGRSIHPKDIPLKHTMEEEMSVAEYEILKKEDWEAETQKGNKPLKNKGAWFKEVPEVISNDGKTVKVRGKAWLIRGEKKMDVRPKVSIEEIK